MEKAKIVIECSGDDLSTNISGDSHMLISMLTDALAQILAECRDPKEDLISLASSLCIDIVKAVSSLEGGDQ